MNAAQVGLFTSGLSVVMAGCGVILFRNRIAALNRPRRPTTQEAEVV